ncbi:hypothetical protein ACE38V_20100 [Cytobacillus sp. Hz8]
MFKLTNLKNHGKKNDCCSITIKEVTDNQVNTNKESKDCCKEIEAGK